jgi:CheY-like chemotaxis protein
MPGMDGLELARRIKQPGGTVPAPAVVLVTAFGQEEVRREAGVSPIDSLLHKPVHQSMLVDTLVGLFAQGVPAELAAYGSSEQVPRLDGLRVLLNEDNEINQQIALELMQAAGVAVDLADNGRIGVDKLLAAGPGGYDLVFMDLQMPVMDGHQATALIRADARFARLPIIAMTAHAMVEERARCLAEGMDDHITKPIDPALLYRTLRQWGGAALAARPRAPAGDQRPPVQAVAADGADAARRTAPATLPPLQADGLDSAAGLRRVNGNRPLYASLLRRFCEHQAQAPARIAELLAGGARHEAEIVAHTLKGVAANIGAEGVAAAAGQLEHDLRADAGAAQVQASLAQVGLVLQPLLHQLAQGFASATSARPAPAAAAPAALRADLQRLGALLEAMDGDTQELLGRLQPDLATLMPADTLATLGAHVDRYDFDEALALLHASAAWTWATQGAQAAPVR